MAKFKPQIHANFHKYFSNALFLIQIVKEFIYLWLFYLGIKDIYESYKKVYTSIKKTERTPFIVQNIILYEKLLSNYNILVETKIYEKMNSKLSVEWKELKKKYDIINK